MKSFVFCNECVKNAWELGKEQRKQALEEVLKLFLRKAMKYDYFNSEFVIEFQKELEAKLKEVQK